MHIRLLNRMAYVRKIGRAREITELYIKLATDLEPACLHSSLRKKITLLFKRVSFKLTSLDLVWNEAPGDGGHPDFQVKSLPKSEIKCCYKDLQHFF